MRVDWHVANRVIIYGVIPSGVSASPPAKRICSRRIPYLQRIPTRVPLGVHTRLLREFPSRPLPGAAGMGFFDSTGSALRVLPVSLRMTALKRCPSNRRPHRLSHAAIIPFQYAGMATLRVGVPRLDSSAVLQKSECPRLSYFAGQ